MFCAKCGSEMKDGDVFCARCGQRVGDTVATASVGSILTKAWTAIKKHKSMVLMVLVLVLFVAGCSYFNSVSYLEKQLTENTWYRDTNVTEGGGFGTILRFYQNGEVEEQNYMVFSSGWYKSVDHEPEWELMDDKTLCYDGEYYEWGTEWSLSGGKLTIGNDEFYDEDTFGYGTHAPNASSD